MINFVSAKRHYILALAILFVVVSLSGTTYSLFLKSDTTNTFNYTTGLLDLQFTEDNPISLSSAFPKIDSEGMTQEPYTLTLKNTGTLTYLFNLKMLSTTVDNVIDSKYIKVQVNDYLPETLYESNQEIIKNMIIYPGEEITFKIRIWLDISTPNAELGKTFNAKVAATGNAIYKTLDSSGANHPKLISDMIPIYYDDASNIKIADSSNTINTYNWYNYDKQMWANTVIINNTDKQIYDITGKNNIKTTDIKYNNDNIVIEDKYFTIPANYNLLNISNIIRIKFDKLIDKSYIITNNKISYYYDNKTKRFAFTNGNQTVYSKEVNLEENKWYIIGYTYDTNNINFYLDGIKLSSATITGTINNNNFLIGTNITNDIVSNITIGDIYMYSDILTDKEINDNYKTNINIIYDNLLFGYNEFTPMTKKEYYLSRPIGTTIKKEDISSYYVWIPRYKYKVWNVTGENQIDTYNAYNNGINIEFENGTTSSGTIYCKENICYSDELNITQVTKGDNGKYYTHPAFRNGDEELTGFWVNKYEYTKEDNTALSNTDLSTFYKIIKNISKENNYHIIKNTEWGAITYLSHSKYGVCQNNKCQEIKPNTTNIKGNESKDTTTYNQYGVFDMSGSLAEFTMSNYANQSKELSLSPNSFNNIAIPNTDYDLYFENKFILGDATKEISLNNSSWYNTNNSFLNTTNNWLIRGGIANQENTNIFSYNATTDTKNEYITTRITIK